MITKLNSERKYLASMRKMKIGWKINHYQQ